MPKSYTWVGANGGSWTVASNWNDGSSPSTGSPGENDFAQFTSFSGKVTGSVGAQTLDIGPGSNVSLGGDGSFSQINVGQDANFNAGAATLDVAAGHVVSASMLELGSPLGGIGTLNVAGTFATSGGVIADQTAVADRILVTGSGEIFDGANLSMDDGGLIQISPTGRMVIGSASTGGVSGALTIDKTFTFFGEGRIAGNVVDNGTLETFNGGFSAKTLTVTGALTGQGQVSVVQELDAGGAIGTGVVFALAGNGGANAGTLRLAHAFADKGVLATMSTHSVIALTGLQFNQVQWATGFLTVTGASGTLKLRTSGDHSHQTFAVRPDAVSGTDIVVAGTTPALESPAGASGRNGVAGFAQAAASYPASHAAGIAPTVQGRTDALAMLLGARAPTSH